MNASHTLDLKPPAAGSGKACADSTARAASRVDNAANNAANNASTTTVTTTAPADAQARHRQVPCTVELAHTPEDFYAHVVLDGVEVGPGDQVLVHDAPTTIAYGEHRVCETRATVSRATWLGRLWTRLTARFELTMLYEVSFSSARFAKSAHQPYPRRPIAPRAAAGASNSSAPSATHDATATPPRRAA